MATTGLLKEAPIQFEVVDDVRQGGVLCALPALLGFDLLRHTGELQFARRVLSAGNLFLVLSFLSLAHVASMEALTGDRLGTQRSSLCEILLDPRRLIVTAQGGIYSLSDDSGTESVGSTTVDPMMEDQRDLIPAAHAPK